MGPRKSATKTEARERARKAAAESMAREERLLELGEEFFIAQSEAEQIMRTAEQRIAEIRAKAEQEATATKAPQGRVVVGMRDEHVGVSEMAQRLELTVAEVRALLKDAPSSAPADGANGSADNGDTAAHETAPEETAGV